MGAVKSVSVDTIEVATVEPTSVAKRKAKAKAKSKVVAAPLPVPVGLAQVFSGIVADWQSQSLDRPHSFIDNVAQK